MSIYRLKGTSGPVLNQAFTLSGKLLIGSAEDCDVRIEGEGVADRHAEVRLSEAGAIVLRNLDAARQTLCNGVAVEEAELGSGDEIRVGQARLMVQAPGLRPARVLGEPSRPSRPRWPWWLLAAATAAALLGWGQGWWGP